MSIKTPLGTILHTGDWKIDPNPLIGSQIDEQKLLKNEGELFLSSKRLSAIFEAEEKKYDVVDKIKNIFQNKMKNNQPLAGQKILSILTVNGVRIHLEDGSWGLVRASSNSPNLVVVCESTVSEDRMKEVFHDLNSELIKFEEIGDYDQKI